MRISTGNDAALVHSDAPLTEQEQLQEEIRELRSRFDALCEKMKIAGKARNRRQYQAARVKAESLAIELKKLGKIYNKKFPKAETETVIETGNETQT